MIRKTLLGALALLTLAPAAVAAQATIPTDEVSREERADVLSEQGWLLANQRREFGLAASWLREAALLRAKGPEKVQDLLNAGRFHFYAHQPLGAASAMKEAGELAMELGDRDTADRAFRDGAWVAAQAGDMVTARDLMKRAGPVSTGIVASR